MATRHLRNTNIGEYYPFHIGTFTPNQFANPTVQAAGAANATASTFGAGAYTITYSFVSTYGQTIAAPTSAAITLTANQSILTTAVSPPAGATVNWYLVSAPSGNLGFVANNNGAALTISAPPAAQAAQPQTVNTASQRLGLPQTLAQAITYGLDGALDLGHGVYVGSLISNTVGSGCTLTLFNGNTGNPNTIISTMSPTTNVTLHYDCVVTQGLYFTYSGTTAGSLTLSVLPVTN